MRLREKNEIMRDALQQIADPVGYWKRYAEVRGNKSDTEAAERLASNADFLKDVAQTCLEKIEV